MGLKKILSGCEAEASGPRKTAAERVFETARDLFYHRGIRAVGVDEIVSQAGVTKPSLYRAFASKDDLVAACLEQSGREGRAELDALVAVAPDDPGEQLRVIVRYFAEKMAKPDFRGCPMSNTAVEFPEPGHPGRIVLEACKTELRARLGELARKLDVGEPEGLADGLVLIIEGAMASHHIFGSQGPSAAMLVTADALINAYKAMDRD
ncbi:transcriptional regulator, TetR family [Sphingomonas sp. YR710]|uniref:TetR/AcrR family transcriptional regulator n=1 Tax=Sphingomonas sp. YR710 TaxID=1882773 RepID=UPI000883A66A|nr:TetR/AcrR family transcriptional regulator [Sphingomonas sp. YR710]SDD30067.1 transcriptional regulator, TetR family [Sphingomonas sp. YR710]